MQSRMQFFLLAVLVLGAGLVLYMGMRTGASSSARDNIELVIAPPPAAIPPETVAPPETPASAAPIPAPDPDLPLPALHGRVTDAEGNPLNGAIVSVKGPVTKTESTDREGVFAFRKLPDGEYTVQATLREGVSDLVTCTTGGPPIELKIVMPPELGGTVVVLNTNAPIANFELGVKPGRHTGQSLWETQLETESGIAFDDGKPRFQRFSAQDGTFLLTGLPDKPFTLFARAKDFAPGALVVEEEDKDVVIGLEASLPLKGRVATMDGKPIAAAAIFIGSLPSLEELAAKRDPGGVSATDGSGNFSVESPPAGTVRLYAWHPDYMPNYAIIEDRKQVAEIVLSGGGAIAGIVTNEGQPVENVKIIVTSDALKWPGEEGGDEPISFSASTVTNAQGEYSFEHVPVGRDVLSCSPQLPTGEFATIGKYVNVNDGETATCDIDLEQAEKINLGIGQ